MLGLSSMSLAWARALAFFFTAGPYSEDNGFCFRPSMSLSTVP
jgi:hypothetical protein